MKSLSTFAYARDNFSNLRSVYVKGQSVEQKPNLAATLKTIELMVKDTKKMSITPLLEKLTILNLQ